jgi:hypothetical protein
MQIKFTPDRLQRKAVVYVRGSSMGQVMHNQESQRRRYGLVERASELGLCHGYRRGSWKIRIWDVRTPGLPAPCRWSMHR